MRMPKNAAKPTKKPKAKGIWRENYN
jgi:hypothetical protein